MSTPTFAATHNLVAFLEKPTESKGFEQIIDFLNAKPIKYALTVNPTVYTSCIKQFWATAKVKKVNGQDQIQALVDKQKVIITEESIRCDIHFDDAEGRQADGFSAGIHFVDTIMVQASEEVGEDSGHPTDSNHIPIDTQPSTSKPQKKQKPRRKQRQDSEVPSPTNEIPVKESVLTPSNDPLPSGEDSFQLNELMVLCTILQKQVFDLEKAKTAQAKEIATLKKRVKNLERRRRSRLAGLRRLRKVGASRRVESSKDKDSLDDNLMFDAGVLDDEVVMAGEKEEQGTKFDDMDVSTAETFARNTTKISCRSSRVRFTVISEKKSILGWTLGTIPREVEEREKALKTQVRGPGPQGTETSQKIPGTESRHGHRSRDRGRSRIMKRGRTSESPLSRVSESGTS
ncbi:hypothetical protein Tco_0233233, partial [Tanacetum coccineum]